MSSTDSRHNRITVGGFSAAFEQMCNFVAVAKTGDPEATVLGLVKLCFTILPDEIISEEKQLTDIIDHLFGIKVPVNDVVHALDQLYTAEVLLRDQSGRYTLAAIPRAEIQQRIDDATSLEGRVRAAWQAQIESDFPELPVDKAWLSLRGYLFRAFRRHGIQSAALLDPAFTVDPSHETSLAALLKESVSGHFSVPQRSHAERAVAGFLAELGRDVDRAKYVAQLADAAFSFYTLQVPPEISETLRKRLRELTLFLDTNFLFGILDLHYNSQVDASHDLLRAITAHQLPFKLRFHAATQDEMRRTIGYFANILRARQWSRSLSRAAAQTRQLTGIEQKFHERNAEHLIDVDEFMRPIQHCDAVLLEKDIKIYRPADNRMEERSELYHEYKEFLEQNGRPEKSYETIQHDGTVLDATRLLRTKAKSSLDAGALLVTCDYLLYKFDRDASRRTGQLQCVVLPNMLWQLLRPFITTDADFDRSFAETFAIPEFRAIGSGGAKACSKMLSILATYKDVPERTAFNLMTDGMLIGRLQNATSDDEFTKVVESAMVEENRALLEETSSLREALAERAQTEKEAEDLLRRREQEIQDVQQTADKTIGAHRSQIDELQSQLAGIEEAKQQRRVLYTYLVCLAVIIFASWLFGWWIAALFPWWIKVIGRYYLSGILAITLFIGGHLLFEWRTKEHARMAQLWPFVQVRRFRTFLWSFMILSFTAGVIGNLIATRIQSKMDSIIPEPPEAVAPATNSRPK
jgi:hypothetical protein